jgi:hypothetical protein
MRSGGARFTCTSDSACRAATTSEASAGSVAAALQPLIARNVPTKHSLAKTLLSEPEATHSLLLWLCKPSSRHHTLGGSCQPWWQDHSCTPAAAEAAATIDSTSSARKPYNCCQEHRLRELVVIQTEDGCQLAGRLALSMAGMLRTTAAQ